MTTLDCFDDWLLFLPGRSGGMPRAFVIWRLWTMMTSGVMAMPSWDDLNLLWLQEWDWCLLQDQGRDRDQWECLQDDWERRNLENGTSAWSGFCGTYHKNSFSGDGVDFSGCHCHFNGGCHYCFDDGCHFNDTYGQEKGHMRWNCQVRY